MQHLNSLLAEQVQIAPAFIPVDLATAGATGDWVSLKNFATCALVIIKATGSGSEDPVLTFQQAVDVSGTSAKNLAAVTRFHKKTGADVFAIGTFTEVSQTAANTVTVEGGEQSVIVVEFKSEDLDVGNGFDCLRVTIADPGATANIAAGLYILRGARFLPSGVAPTAIAD